MQDKKALHITKEAKNNTFNECDIGGARIEGQGTKMIKTRIYNYRKKYPKTWVGFLITLLVSLGTAILSLILEYRFF